ncbi:FliM/FliN family flagellar motor switch protein [Chromobacterium alticapitis]|uniref:Flagellar motor switch protein FliN-like C-terminal domain-containing protein n=1 Tax=Chromobacterium alticapitis TaxID=2073169 RepID=A0A2S5DL29_9NEIS|nr:FliM/FliN family flagellar motor C-terminal domain-containing protein [Chromobacterium alticapitis]POZ63773.1 hypothetical protein C2I19_01595 [Chromobacterium alticapitis]
MNAVLPYRLYAHSELAAIESGARERCAGWLDGWSMAGGELDVSARAVSLPDLAGMAWLAGEDALPALADDTDACAFFAGVCLGVKKSRAALSESALALSALNAARAALGRALTGAAPDGGYGETPLRGEDLSPLFSAVGAVRLELRVAGLTLTALLSAGQAAGLLPVSASLAALPSVSLRSLPLEREVELEVRAAPARLSLRDLDSLCPGDVIRLDQKTGAPFELCLPDGGVLGTARYGSHGGRPAVKVARLSTQINKSGRA